MSWGIELWDRYEDLCNHTKDGIDFLENKIGDFVKERGNIERKYASELRALVKKYTPKNSVKTSDNKADNGNKKSGPASIVLQNVSADEEYSHVQAYKEMLKEVGFQAGQHEVIAEAFSKEIARNVSKQVKELREDRRKNKRVSEKLVNDLNSAYSEMTKSKDLFRKSFEEQERAIQAFKKADADGNVSRNDVERMRLTASTKTASCDSTKHTFADQLVKTNAFRQRYYHELLPGVLDELQSMEQKRIELIRHGILSCVAKEREVMHIISKCHDCIQTAMDSIDPQKDTSIVIEKHKSGDVPPGDFKFEDMQDPRSMLRDDHLASTGPTNFNLYPRKKELEKHMAAIETELGKSQKELKSLNQMVGNPKFGNAKKVKSEIQSLHAHVNDLETTLTSIRAEHVDVEEKLEALKNRSSSTMIYSSPMNSLGLPNNRNTLPIGSRLNRGGSTNSSGGSVKSSSLSIASSGQVYDVPSASASDDYDEIPPPPPEVLTPPASDTMSSMSSPSVSSASSSEAGHLKRCVALYTFNNANMEESNIPMEEGEEFFIVDDDCDGWTRVRRVISNHEFGEEGFVPTTWIKIL